VERALLVFLEVVGLQVLLIGFLGGIVLVYSKNTSVSLPASFYENEKRGISLRT
jgi:hypothetical protein